MISIHTKAVLKSLQHFIIEGVAIGLALGICMLPGLYVGLWRADEESIGIGIFAGILTTIFTIVASIGAIAAGYTLLDETRQRWPDQVERETTKLEYKQRMKAEAGDLSITDTKTGALSRKQ